MGKCVGWKKGIMNWFKLIGVSSNASHRVLFANQLKAKRKVNRWTRYGFLLTERFFLQMHFAWESMNSQFSGERQLKIQLGSFHDVSNRLHNLCDVWPWNLRAPPLFSEAKIGQTNLNCWGGKSDLLCFLAYSSVSWQILGAQMWIVSPGQSGVHTTTSWDWASL